MSAADVEEQICSAVLQLTSGDSSDDYRSEAVAVSLESKTIYIHYSALEQVKKGGVIFRSCRLVKKCISYV